MVRFAPLVCVLALLAGCGGGDGDAEEVEQTVRDLVTAINERDGDRYCDELITEEFREQSTFSTGDRASESCKRQLRAIKGLRVELVRVTRTRVDGDRASVTAVLRRQGGEIRQRFQLEKDGGGWRVAGGAR